MKNKTKILIFAAVSLLLLLMMFVSIPRGGDKKLSDLSGVILAPPQGYLIIDDGQNDDLSGQEAAEKLLGLTERYPQEQKLGLKFRHASADGYYVIDLEKNIIQKIAANEFGTVVQTTWRGRLKERLAAAIAEGDFAPQGFSPPVSQNLYH